MAQHSDRPAGRRAAHAKARPGYSADRQARPNPGPGWPYPGADHPSWPANAVEGSWADGAPDPSWPYPGADHPSWPAGGADWPQPGTDYSSWPADEPGSGWVPAHGGDDWFQREAPAVQQHDQRWLTAAPVPPRAPVPATRWEYPARPAGAHAKTQRWSAQPARTQDPAARTYYELAFGDGRLQVMPTEPPATGQEWATGRDARPVQVLQPGSEPAGPVAWEAGEFRNADSVRVAERILSDADYQAAEICREACAQATAIREAAEQDATEIRRQASAQAAPVREAAEREAAMIRQQAAAQAAAIREPTEREAAAIREAAQREADALRSAVETMSADLDRVAAYITERFTGPIERISGDTRPAEGRARLAGAFAAPADRSTRPVDGYPEPVDGYAALAPAAAPDGAPSPQEEAGPHADGPQAEATRGARATSRAIPATTPARPRTRPARPATKPAEKPARSRQSRTMHAFAGTIAALVVIAVGTGAYQLATRGFTSFVFRSAGTGATDNNAIFPGIIPTPKPSPTHHHPTTGPGQQGTRGRHHRHHHRGTHHHVKGR